MRFKCIAQGNSGRVVMIYRLKQMSQQLRPVASLITYGELFVLVSSTKTCTYADLFALTVQFRHPPTINIRKRYAM